MRNGSRSWQYAAAGAVLAGIAAVISYNDGLFVARLAGNHDHQAFLYPLLPDLMIVVCLLALLEAARAGVPRSGWATAGLVLGAGLTLAMNVGAGIAHSELDAVMDGFVPVIFFVACEVVLWHVRRGRAGSDTSGAPATSRRSVPSGNFEAAKLSMRETAAAGNPWSRNQLQSQFGLSRAEATKLWQPYQSPAEVRPPAPSAGSRLPAGSDPPAPAGGGGRDAPPGLSVPAAVNGQGRHG